MDKYQQLVDELIKKEYLTDPAIIEAFKKTPRKHFLQETHKNLEGVNAPLPIGEGQTISQPLTVAFMLHLLHPKPGEKILEIGYGSGWQTAILARVVHRKDDPGEIFAYEIVDEVAKFGKKNLEEFLPDDLAEHVHLFQQDYTESSEKNAPYDKVIAAAAFDETPSGLIKQLKVGGIIVYPTKANDIRKITRETDEKYTEDIFPGFVFVPITH
jgi:protein-L-isoaspartate(D-aspartate) O-methyltransferase